MYIYNKEGEFDTKDVKMCTDLSKLTEYEGCVEADIISMESRIEAGKCTEKIFTALRMQKILLKQIQDQIDKVEKRFNRQEETPVAEMAPSEKSWWRVWDNF